MIECQPGLLQMLSVTGIQQIQFHFSLFCVVGRFVPVIVHPMPREIDTETMLPYYNSM